MSAPFIIDVFADPVCPWCWIGKRRLEAALASRPQVEAVVRWQPFQLDPTIPPEGVDRAEYLSARFKDEERIREMHERLTAIGRDEGIALLFSEISRSPNSMDAHRAIRWAAEEGPSAQGAFIERLFEAYFTEGEDISDREAIARCAEEAGLDWETLRDRLDSDEDVELIREEIARARAIGVEGVPCFIFDGKLVVMGAHPGEVLAEAIDRALSEADEPPAV